MVRAGFVGVSLADWYPTIQESGATVQVVASPLVCNLTLSKVFSLCKL